MKSSFLERTYSMWIPGFGTEDPKQYKKFLTNDALKAVGKCFSNLSWRNFVIHSLWKRLTPQQQQIAKHQRRNNNNNNNHRLNRVNHFTFQCLYLLTERNKIMYIYILKNNRSFFCLSRVRVTENIYTRTQFSRSNDLLRWCRWINKWNHLSLYFFFFFYSRIKLNVC